MTTISTQSAAVQTQSLFILRNADMTVTTDQAFARLGSFSSFIVTNVIAVRRTGAFGVACLGGIYTGASKSGSALLAAAQSWSLMTGAGSAQTAALANLLQSVAATATPFLSLTTGNTGALTADLFISGIVVD